MKSYIALILIIASLLTTPGVSARTLAALTFAECVDSALLYNPALKAKEWEVERASILKGTAFDPANTSVTLKQETTGGGGPDNGVAFSQEFDFPSVYVARKKSLKIQEDVETAGYRLMINDAVRDLADEYQSALYLQHLIALNDSLEFTYNDFLKVARARLEAGEAGQLEVMNAERMLEKCFLQRAELESRYLAGLNRLKFLTGCQHLFTPADKFEAMTAPDTGVEFSFASSPRGASAENLIRLAEAGVSLEKQKFFPGINLGVTVQALIKGFNPYHIEREPFNKGNFMAFEAGITLPVFFWSQHSRLKAAKADLTIARLQNESALLEAETQYASLLNTLRMQSQTISHFQEKSLPRAEEIKRISTISYSLGDIDYMEFINNMETVFGILSDYATAVSDYNHTVILLNHLIGTR